jgi:hypothetical protein
VIDHWALDVIAIVITVTVCLAALVWITREKPKA